MRWQWAAVVAAIAVLLVSSVAPHATTSPSAGPMKVPTQQIGGASARGAPTPAAPPRLLVHPLAPLYSAVVTTIYPNGTISNVSAPISVNGPTYTLTGTLYGTLVIERNDTTLTANGGQLIANSTTDGLVIVGTTGVTVTNFLITTSEEALYAENDTTLTVRGGSFGASSWAMFVGSSDHVTIVAATITHSEGIYLYEVTNGIVDSVVAWDTGDSVLTYYSSAIAISNLTANNSVTGAYLDWSGRVSVSGSNFTGDSEGIFASGVVNGSFTGNVLDGASDAILATDSSDLTIQDNHGAGDQLGAYLYNVADSELRGDSFRLANTEGTYVDLVSNLTITGCDFSGANGTGFEAATSAQLTVTQTNVSDFGRYGFWSQALANSTLTGIVASDGAPGSAAGFYTSGDTSVTIAGSAADRDPAGLVDYESIATKLTGDTFTGNGSTTYDVELQFSVRAVLTDVQFEGTPATALALFTVQGVQVLYSSFGSSGVDQILAEYGSQLMIERNTFASGNGTGLNFQLVAGFTVLYNGFVGAVGADGLAANFTEVQGGLVENNTFVHVSTAIAISASTGTRLIGNNATDCGTGLRGVTNVNLTVAANGFLGDTISFDLTGNFGSWIFHNNFINDSGWRIGTATYQQIWWDGGYPDGGNFWNNHTRPDLYAGPKQNVPAQLGDGIVDTPVNLSGGEQDPYPLAFPWNGYSIGFSETGLLPGTEWNVTVNGLTYSTRSNILYYWFIDGPGTVGYNYSIPRVPGYLPAQPANGSGIEGRYNVVVPVIFPTYNFAVTFEETGLPAGTTWAVYVAKTERITNSSSFNLNFSNGTYTYLPEQVGAYSVYSPPGSFIVQGSPLIILVAYYPPPAPKTTGSSLSDLGQWVAIGVAVLLAIALVVLLFRRRRGPPSQLSAWSGSVPPGASGGRSANSPTSPHEGSAEGGGRPPPGG